MNSNRSLRSNTNLAGRISPNLQSTRADSRSSSPMNNSLSRIREDNGEINLSPMKNFNDGDRRFHQIAFERCADRTDRELITDREKFVQGKLANI